VQKTHQRIIKVGREENRSKKAGRERKSRRSCDKQRNSLKENFWEEKKEKNTTKGGRRHFPNNAKQWGGVLRGSARHNGEVKSKGKNHESKKKKKNGGWERDEVWK